MAQLNTTGAISLGGTVSGQSIELLLGGTGSSVITMNDTNVRNLAGVTSGAISMPTNFYGATKFIQDGNAIQGSGYIVPSFSTTRSLLQGGSVAISLDGNTIAFGSSYDNGDSSGASGAVYVWTKSGSTWTQQAKLFSAGSYQAQGTSIALSADGNILAVGAIGTSSSAIGTTFIWTRSGATWTQVTNLVGSGVSLGESYQGYSISMTPDGTTLAVGGYFDGANVGAVWIFTSSGGGTSWAQQGGKLTGAGQIGAAAFGKSVSISSDGNTLVVGAPSDNSGIGATYIFTRSGSTWTQQTRLVMSGTRQGSNVAISGDASTVFIGANGNYSAAFVCGIYSLSGGILTLQSTFGQGGGTGNPSGTFTSDGNTLFLGVMPLSGTGGAYVYKRSGTTWSTTPTTISKTYTNGTVGWFGASVACTPTGSQLIVGASNTSVTGLSNPLGAVFVYI